MCCSVKNNNKFVKFVFLLLATQVDKLIYGWLFYTQDRANELFKQVHEQKSLKGRSNDAIASACLYIACRQEGVPRTFKGKIVENGWRMK